ncbi:ABC transporter permease [Marinomonas ushuaiensis DSM 15871]|uniref:ABC transporter permease n=1 Tax=Marinomonas ushuaiensis DSM 15871 TaxID=1122207 RepID=X7EAZ2_9GAMM|nr:iron ABC transporter permease [Marinomonas ushuaiensis]ETX12366.1 ABC transporter permease [Marinomonas ushuaiensis DSM 15871]
MNVSKQKTMLIAKIPLRVLLFALSIFLIILMGVAIGVGSVPISQSTVWGVIGNKLSFTNSLPTWSMGRENIVWAVRLPRVILAAIVGATLAVVGAALQSVTRNPLADPHLLGISSGAALGAIIALLHTGMILGVVTVPVFAFLGALFAMFLVLGVANFSMAHSAGRLILAGVAVAFVLTALGNLFIFMGDHRASHTVIFWMLGGLGLAQWGQLWFPFFTLLLGAGYLIYKARYLNAMMLGDETASTLGVPVQRFRLIVIVVCALLTGAAVAFSGVIGFVGLMVPHIVRLLVGGDYRKTLPLSALFGALFLVFADIIARVIIPPEDMPIGILTGLAGGIAFVFLMRQRRNVAL